MVVRTDTEAVRKAVTGVLEFLLIHHPIDCPICDQAGECGLQDYYMEYGLHKSRYALEDKVHKKKVQEAGSGIVLDAERCILCSRCVRFLDEVTGTRELQFFRRGDHSEISFFPGRPIDNHYAGNLADICPVGALTSRDFRFKCRVWFLEGDGVDLHRVRPGMQRRGAFQRGHPVPVQAARKRGGQPGVDVRLRAAGIQEGERGPPARPLRPGGRAGEGRFVGARWCRRSRTSFRWRWRRTGRTPSR